MNSATALIRQDHSATRLRSAAPRETELIEALLSAELLTAEAAERVRHASATSGTPFCAAATRLGLVSEGAMAAVFGEVLGIPVADRSAFPARAPRLAGLNPEFLRTHRVFPLGEDDSAVWLAMANPLDEVAAEGVGFVTGRAVQRLAARESDIEDSLDSSIDGVAAGPSEPAPAPGTNLPQSGAEDLDRLSDRASDAPVIRLVHRLLTGAMDAGASDVHLEPSPSALVVRYRIDGLLQEAEVLSGRWCEPVASRVKLMARLDIAEKRVPQDGRIRFTARGRSLDLRVATFPTLHGEALVLRLLGQQTVALRLESLGLHPRHVSTLHRALARPHGVVLITGPTGSGKTTTLYAALNALLRPELKVVTVEDPVEYTLEGVSQLQVKPDIGLTYASALRSVLRNDPDVIMIGEIRDRETADIAVRAALTGHLVLATLHTNTAAGAVTRLLDLGVEDYLLASTLVLAAAQRLVRSLCPACRQTRDATPEEARLLAGALGEEYPVPRVPVATGCPQCAGRGFSGRVPLFEALPIDAEARSLIRGFRDEQALAKSANGKGGWRLWRDGVQKVIDGVTTLDEIMSVVEEDSR